MTFPPAVQYRANHSARIDVEFSDGEVWDASHRDGWARRPDQGRGSVHRRWPEVTVWYAANRVTGDSSEQGRCPKVLDRTPLRFL